MRRPLVVDVPVLPIGPHVHASVCGYVIDLPADRAPFTTSVSADSIRRGLVDISCASGDELHGLRYDHADTRPEGRTAIVRGASTNPDRAMSKSLETPPLTIPMRLPMPTCAVVSRVFQYSMFIVFTIAFGLCGTIDAQNAPTTTTINASGSTGNYTLTGVTTGPALSGASLNGSLSFEDTTTGGTVLGQAGLGSPSYTEGFVEEPSVNVGPTTSTVAYSVITGDFNNDGKQDFIVEDTVHDILYLYLGNGDGTFGSAQTIQLPTPSSTNGTVATADLNRDGNLDLVFPVSELSNSFNYTVGVMLGNGNGTFQAITYIPDGHPINVIHIADVNGDGVPDVLADASQPDAPGATAGAFFDVLLGNGNGTFRNVGSLNFGSNTYYPAINFALGDFNNDGKQDIVVTAGAYSTGPQLCLGNGDGTFQACSYAFGNVDTRYVVTSDFNRDGKLDVMFLDSFGQYVTVYLGNGSGGFTALPRITASFAGGIAVSDFNGDGISDVVLTTASPTNGFFYLQGNGDGTFTKSTYGVTGTTPQDLALGDFTSNQEPDLVIPYLTYPTGTAAIILDKATVTATASLSGVSVSSGTHYVDAFYPGNSRYGSSVSSTVPLVGAQVAPLATSATLSVNMNPITEGLYWQSTCTVTSPSGVPGGTVSFYDNGALATTATLGNGSATWGGVDLGPGTNNVYCVYGAQNNFAAATSNTVAEVVTNGTVTEPPTSTVNPTNVGQSTTFTSLVDTGFVTLGGTVDFLSDGRSIGTASVTNVSATNLIQNSNNMLAAGWGGYCGALSNLTENTTDLAAPDGSMTAGKIVITDPSVCSGGSSDGFINSLPSGLTAGQTYTASIWVRATAPASVVFGLSDCYTVTQNIGTTWTRLVLTASVSSSCNENSRGLQLLTGGPKTLYFWGAQVENSASVGPYVATIGSQATGYGGVASLAYSGLPAGVHAITASYSGNSALQGSTSFTALSQTVNQVTPAVTLSVTPSTGPFGTIETASVHVSCNTACGSVDLRINGGEWGTVALDSNGNYTATRSFDPLGTYSVQANYLGNGSYAAASSSTVPYTVTPASTTSTLTVNANPIPANQNNWRATCTVTSPSGIPGGTVSFYSNGTLEQSSALSNGSAIWRGNGVVVGTQPIYCAYAAQNNYAASTSNTISQQVSPDYSVSLLTSSVNPSTYPSPVTFTDLINTGGIGPTGTPLAPTGTVSFSSNGTTLGSAKVTSVSATNLNNWSTLISKWSALDGSITDNATTGPDGSVTASLFQSGQYAANFPPASGTPAPLGSTYTFSIWLKLPSGGTPFTAQIYLLDYGTSTQTPLLKNCPVTARWTRCSATYPIVNTQTPGIQIQWTGQAYYAWGAQLEVASMPGPYVATYGSAATGLGGLATFTTSSLPAGADTISAVYGGDTYTPTSTATLLQTVNAEASTVTLASSLNPSVYGVPVTFTATVPTGATGTVAFSDGGVLLSTATVSGTTATMTAVLPVGSHSITATYSGGGNFAGSTSNTVVQVVARAAAVISVVTSKDPSIYWDQVTFTVTAAGVAGGLTPTGTFTVMDGTNVLGTITLNGGTATFTEMNFVAGQHNLQFVYGGDTSYD